MRDTIGIDDLAGFEDALKKMGTEVATGIGHDAVLAAANLLKDAWIEGAPYAPRASTKKYWIRADGTTKTADYGHLRDNIEVRPVRAQQANAIVFKVTTGDAYWGYIREFGSVKQPARPWARPIVDRMRDELIRVEIDVLRSGIEAVAGGVTTGGYGKVMANGRNA